jgi:hypothetical protein
MYEVFTFIEPCVFLSGFELTVCSKVVLGCPSSRSEIHNGHKRSVPLHSLNLKKPISLYSSSFGICSASFCSPSYKCDSIYLFQALSFSGTGSYVLLIITILLFCGNYETMVGAIHASHSIS